LTNTTLIDRTVGSDRAELAELSRLLDEIRPLCRLNDDTYYNLVIALTEAVNNAIVHGNRSNRALKVHYRVESTPEGILCTVEDEGPGFDPDAVADPISPENLLRDGGRGIFIIRTLMRDLELVNTGHGMRVRFLCARE
jgi:serine/threonine-protein kinase RsbW